MSRVQVRNEQLLERVSQLETQVQRLVTDTCQLLAQRLQHHASAAASVFPQHHGGVYVDSNSVCQWYMQQLLAGNMLHQTSALSPNLSTAHQRVFNESSQLVLGLSQAQQNCLNVSSAPQTVSCSGSNFHSPESGSMTLTTSGAPSLLPVAGTISPRTNNGTTEISQQQFAMTIDNSSCVKQCEQASKKRNFKKLKDEKLPDKVLHPALSTVPDGVLLLTSPLKMSCDVSACTTSVNSLTAATSVDTEMKAESMQTTYHTLSSPVKRRKKLLVTPGIDGSSEATVVGSSQLDRIAHRANCDKEMIKNESELSTVSSGGTLVPAAADLALSLLPLTEMPAPLSKTLRSRRSRKITVPVDCEATNRDGASTSSGQPLVDIAGVAVQ